MKQGKLEIARNRVRLARGEEEGEKARNIFKGEMRQFICVSPGPLNEANQS